MNFDFNKHKELRNLIPLELPGKEDYYTNLVNLEGSWTGKVDARLVNTFIHEAIQLIINGIVLFEQGYYDAAYYSLRQSLEVSTTMVYLTELEPEIKKEELQKWKSKSKFPMYGQMINFLDMNGSVFSDIRNKMKNYFDELKKVKENMNKYVHKQGFDTFYVSRRQGSARVDTTVLIKDFENCLTNCIGAIAVFRLAMDPFPVLLMDYEIYSRTGDLLTEPFSKDFVYKYIGHKNIKAYKKTEIFQSYYDYFINEEQKKPCVLDVVKFQHIDKEKIDEILNQKHLLSNIDFLVVKTVSLSEKISSAYGADGWLYYTTSTKSARTSYGFDSSNLRNIKESENHFNIPYDEVFLSYLNLDSEELFLEHNEKFELDEFVLMKTYLKSIALNMNQFDFNGKKNEANC